MGVLGRRVNGLTTVVPAPAGCLTKGRRMWLVGTALITGARTMRIGGMPVESAGGWLMTGIEVAVTGWLMTDCGGGGIGVELTGTVVLTLSISS